MTRTSLVGGRLTMALAVFALIVVPFAIYVAGYLLLPVGSVSYSYAIERIYSQQWMTSAFRPAAKVEQCIRGIEVEVSWAGERDRTVGLPLIIPPTPAPVIHIADWHWAPEGEHGGGDYTEFLDTVDLVQRQQMAEIRKLGVREVWVEGQSDETIAEHRAHIEILKTVDLSDRDSPVDELTRNVHREDSLQIGAAGRLLLSGELDAVLPLEDHAAWQAAKPVDGVFDLNAWATREQLMANRLPPGAVVVLGAGHDLKPHLRQIRVHVIRVEALPELKQ